MIFYFLAMVSVNWATVKKQIHVADEQCYTRTISHHVLRHGGFGVSSAPVKSKSCQALKYGVSSLTDV